MYYQILGDSREMDRFLRLTRLGMNSEGDNRLEIQRLVVLGTMADIRKHEQ
jgi:hypothetical protein